MSVRTGARTGQVTRARQERQRHSGGPVGCRLFCAVIKFVFAWLLAAVIAVALAACVSSETEVSSTGAATTPDGAVAGETVPNDVQLAPATGTRPSGTMRW